MTEEQDPVQVGLEDDVAALRARVDSLEAMVEGLQDAFHRQVVQLDTRLDDFDRRMDPAELARSMSADARRRGL